MRGIAVGSREVFEDMMSAFALHCLRPVIDRNFDGPAVSRSARPSCRCFPLRQDHDRTGRMTMPLRREVADKRRTPLEHTGPESRRSNGGRTAATRQPFACPTQEHEASRIDSISDYDAICSYVDTSGFI